MFAKDIVEKWVHVDVHDNMGWFDVLGLTHRQERGICPLRLICSERRTFLSASPLQAHAESARTPMLKVAISFAVAKVQACALRDFILSGSRATHAGGNVGVANRGERA